MLTPAAALGADVLLGEPPVRWHPVVWFGRAASALERRTYRSSIVAGAVHCAVLTCGAWCCGVLLRRALGRPTADIVAGTLAVAGSMLATEVATVAGALECDDVEAARHHVARIVGRDTAELDGASVARAAIESLAENSVDAVTAPLFWLAAGGAPAVLAHRAINTLDAMVGHRTDRYRRFGTAAARADDMAAWLPARLTAVVIAALRPGRARTIAAVVRRDAPAHPSPNGGVVEAAFAAALGVRLGGSNRYGSVVDDRGVLGSGPTPTPTDVRRAIGLARSTWWAMAVGVALVHALIPRR